MKRDLLTDAIWTRQDKTWKTKNKQFTSLEEESNSIYEAKSCLSSHEYHAVYLTLTKGDSEGGMEWYKSKNSCKVEESKKAADEKKAKMTHELNMNASFYPKHMCTTIQKFGDGHMRFMFLKAAFT